MMRLKAALLAVAITAVLLGLGFAGAVWLSGPLTAFIGHEHKWLAEWVAIFTGPFIGGMTVFVAVARSRRGDEPPPDDRHLPSASERFRRQVRPDRLG